MSQTDRKYSDYGYELLRETLLPELLNDEHDDIMYWGGKLLARKKSLTDIEEIPAFFERAGWGALQMQKAGKRQYVYTLQLKNGEKKPHFSRHLEAGFLAGQFELLYETTAETLLEKKRGEMRLHVHLDSIPSAAIK
ncbi:DUF2507 domain-containing protein [Natribacillus halophilus]|uniref:DUF2507 domain-containing protein n=1 Tax=Natribacillus halophilus TaxID=549003 RepID=A0A1G8LU79_9BACI|nr:DUF2507 domain-containing protein [Natribacillus halophilus]SDI59205.1 Protein of unknown function [Natribacillus halophilus]